MTVDSPRVPSGPIFANVVVFDELNRATPRTQSPALLEAAEESSGQRRRHQPRLPAPFMLIATQNPIEMAGTYGLGEGALDRFSAVITPGRAAPELEVTSDRASRPIVLGAIEAVATPTQIVAAQAAVRAVHVSDALGRYVVDLLEATRSHPGVRFGASTRAGVSLIALARRPRRGGWTGGHTSCPTDVAGGSRWPRSATVCSSPRAMDRPPPADRSWPSASRPLRPRRSERHRDTVMSMSTTRPAPAGRPIAGHLRVPGGVARRSGDRTTHRRRSSGPPARRHARRIRGHLPSPDGVGPAPSS